MHLTSTSESLHVDALGWALMDEVHDQFAALLAAAAQSDDEQLLTRLEDVAAHCSAHFSMEESWMARSGYPKGECHAQEHAAVLASIAGVRRRVAAGEVQVGRMLVASLQAWFPAHAQHLDSALAHWVSKQRWGGKPLVFRRRAGEPRVAAGAAHRLIGHSP